MKILATWKFTLNQTPKAKRKAKDEVVNDKFPILLDVLASKIVSDLSQQI